MKKINLTFLAAFLMLVPLSIFANEWNTPDHIWFTGQTGIDVMEPFYIKAMATVSFEGKVFHFSNYQDGGKGQISLRKLTNTGAVGTITWSQVKTRGITNLNDLGKYEWQPAPVVFNNVLYLFVGNTSNGISYSTYNAADSSWSALVALPGDFSNTGSKKLGYGMAAVVVDNRLCLVVQNYWSFIQIFTTTDLINWSYFHDSGHSGIVTSSGAANSTYGVVSAISQNYTENGILKSKLKYAYIDGNKHPHTVECSFDDNGNYHQISDAVISTERTYQSVALIEGTVKGDPGSSGHCVQAFLKLNNKDNGYCRYRIQRWQSKEGGSWTKQQDNLVKQNYLWAHQYFNLCAINFAVPDGLNVRQFMCLIYCGYNDWDWPMICASAETDILVYDASKEMTQTLGGPENTQYIGYVEGPPPFYLNNLGNVPDNYLWGTAAISEVEFSTSSSTSTSSEIGYDVGGEVNVNAGCFKAGLNAAFGQVWGSEFTKKITNTITVYAAEEALGYYITLSPVITRAFYQIHDVHGNLIDSTYNFYMTEPYYDLETVDIGQGLSPGDPATYHNRAGINFPSFNSKSFGNTSTSWTGGSFSSVGISIDQSESKTNKITAKLSLSAELGEMFDVGFDGSFDYSLKTTTSVGNEIKSSTRLNPAFYPTDVAKLNFVTYWINPVEGINNWWLHDGALTQNTWCITYDVTYVKYVNGTTIGSGYNPDPVEPVSVEIEIDSIPDSGSDQQISPTKTSLAQNYPNPFKPTTFIKYQIGIDDPQASSDNQGCQTKLAVYNLSGQEVATLVDEWKAVGNYEVELDASLLAPGVYFYSLQSGSFSDVKKLILLK